MKKFFFLSLFTLLFFASCQKDPEPEPVVELAPKIDPDIDLVSLAGIQSGRSGFGFVFYDSSMTFRHLDPAVTTEIQLNGSYVDHIEMRRIAGDAGIDNIFHYRYDMTIYYNNGQVPFPIIAYADFSYGDNAIYVPSWGMTIPVNKFSVTRMTSSNDYDDLYCLKPKKEYQYRVNYTLADSFKTTFPYLRSPKCNTNFFRLNHLRR